MDIQERILNLINKRGWSLYRLAKETGIHATTVYDWFNDIIILRPAENPLKSYALLWTFLLQNFLAESKKTN